ncbi:hypothetical protein [Desulfosarcina variabilis]|uniref:hypothetical protein n=1 Tax=Desulfosarcina variabilis TaxID=2300 RepID=UPI003AFABA86
MNDKAHTSSKSDFSSRSGVTYKNESDVPTFRAQSSKVTGSSPYPPTVMKVARGVTEGSDYSVSFSINVSKMSRQESNYKINNKLSGKYQEVSTKND